MAEESFVFRVTRNGDMDLDEGLYDEDIDWLLVVEQLLKRRNKQAAVRLQLSKPVRTEIWRYLCSKLQLTIPLFLNLLYHGTTFLQFFMHHRKQRFIK
mgnify:CR=1 FL=1